MRRIARGGMTLVELLVVITIIGVLGGIIALVAPRFQESSRVAEGSRQFSNWLQIARQRAQRDKAPRGLRLLDRLPSSVSGVQDFYYKFVYVEQPEDVTGVAGAVNNAPNGRKDLDIQPSGVPFAPPAAYKSQLDSLRTAYQSQVSAALAAAATNPAFTAAQRQKYAAYKTLVINNNNGWKYLLPLSGRILTSIVNDGDVVEFGGARYTLVYSPVVVTTAAGTDCCLILHRQRDEYREFQTTGTGPSTLLVRNTMASPLPAYRITRSVRPIAGEPELTLPSNVAIDFLYVNTGTRTWPVPTGGGTGYFDIVFSPSGEVISGGTGRVIFWIRDVSLDSAAPVAAGNMPPGENRLIVLHCRNGQVTAHPVNPTLTNGKLSDPYSFVRDGKSSASEDE